MGGLSQVGYAAMVSGMIEEMMFGGRKRCELTEGERKFQGGLQGANIGTMLATPLMMAQNLNPAAKIIGSLAAIGLPALTQALKKSALSLKDLSEKAADSAQKFQQNAASVSQFASINETQKRAGGSMSLIESAKLNFAKQKALGSITDTDILKKINAAGGDSNTLQSIMLESQKRAQKQSTVAQAFASASKLEQARKRLIKNPDDAEAKRATKLSGLQLGANLGSIASFDLNEENIDQAESLLGTIDSALKGMGNISEEDKYFAGLSAEGRNEEIKKIRNDHMATFGTAGAIGFGSAAAAGTLGLGTLGGVAIGSAVGSGIGFATGQFFGGQEVDKKVKDAKDKISGNIEEFKKQLTPLLKDGIIDFDQFSQLANSSDSNIMEGFKEMLESQIRSMSNAETDRMLSMNYVLATQLLNEKLTESINQSAANIQIKKGGIKINDMLFKAEQNALSKFLSPQDFASRQLSFDQSQLESEFEIQRQQWVDQKSKILQKNLTDLFPKVGAEGIKMVEASISQFRNAEDPRQP